MSALATRDTNITTNSNPQEKQQDVGGAENMPQDGQQQHKSVLAQKNSTTQGCVHGPQ